MASIDELLAQLDPQRAGAQAFAASESPGFFSGVLDFGLGALEKTFGTLDQIFGQPVRNLLAGRPGAAAEQFARGFLPESAEQSLFGEDDTRLSGRELLEGQNILGARFIGPNQEGLDFGDVLGFGAEILTDPLTFFGGAIGRAVAKPLSRGAGGATRFAEGVAGTPFPGRAAGAAGAKLGTILESSGTSLPIAGGVVGGLSGLALAEEGDSPITAALGGALLGAAGGVGARALPGLSKGALAVGDTFSKRFKTLRTFGREAGEVMLRRERELQAAITKTGALASARLLRQEELLEAAVRESAGQWKEAFTGNPIVTTEAAKRELTALSEQVGFGRTLAAEGDDAALDALRREIAPDAPAIQQGLFDEAVEVQAPSLRSPTAGPDAIDEYIEQLGKLPAPAREVLDQFWTTGGHDALLGKIAADELQIGKGVLTREFVERFRKTHKLERIIHVDGVEDVAELLRGMVGKLDDLDPAIVRRMTVPQKLEWADSLGTGTQRGVVARRLAGGIRELNDQVPGLLEDSITKLGLIESKQVGTRLATANFLEDLLADDQFSKIVADLTDEEKLLQLYRPLPENVVGKEFAKQHGDRWLSSDAYDHLFDPKRGIAKRMLDKDAPHKVAKIWQQINSAWSRITLGPFLSWWTRNLTGNIWNSYLGLGFRAMVSPSGHSNALKLQNAMAKFRRGGKITGSIKVGKQHISLKQLAEEAWDDAVPQTGLFATEAGEGMLDAMSLPELAKAAGRRVKNPIETAKDMIRFDSQQNFFVKSGFGMNAIFEDYMRIHHYLMKRTATGSRGEAAESVIRSLGDMRHLSPGDSALRQGMPFWAWTRFNVPRQIRGIFERPQAAASVGKLKMNLDRENRVDVPDALVPDWLQGQLAVPISRKNGKLEFYAFNRWHPLADLTEIDSPLKFMQFLGNSLGPIQKTILEQSLGGGDSGEGGYNLYFKQAIENHPGERDQFLGLSLQKRWIHVLRNLRLLSGLDATTRTTASAELEALNPLQKGVRIFTGVKPRVIDLKRQRQRRLRQLRIEVGRFRNLASRSRREGDLRNAQNYLRLMEAARDRLRLLSRWKTEDHPLVNN